MGRKKGDLESQHFPSDSDLQDFKSLYFCENYRFLEFVGIKPSRKLILERNTQNGWSARDE